MKTMPKYVTSKSAQILQVGFIALFALLFIIIYHPLNIVDLDSSLLRGWGISQRFISTILTIAVVLVGMGVCGVSRFLMLLYCRKKDISIIVYAAWILTEVAAMAVIYTLGSYINDASTPLDILFRDTIYKTLLILAIPYAISYGLLIWKEQSESLKVLKAELEEKRRLQIQAGEADPYINILDEKGDIRLSVKRENLLYIGAEDNYVCVSYLAGNVVKNIMVRTTLKKVSEQIRSSHIIRCHRSYLVNTDHIKALRREKDGFFIEMGIDTVPDLPVSKTYGEDITSRIMGI